MTDEDFAKLNPSAARRQMLCRAWNKPEPQVCPKCGTRQVQLIDISRHALWRCRECYETFTWEPAYD